MVRAKLRLQMFKRNRPFKVKQSNITILENTERLKEKLESFIENTKDIDIKTKYNKFEELLITRVKSNPSNRKEGIKWLTNETKELLRNRAILTSMAQKTKESRKDIADLSKKI
ncbi:unnamed protein product [Parnassius apollo]|uniref:(apollo) hypothetical protein n=1 Tax=Parnassius apollo TaxID=110799 RepID=A0A8S3YB39_PARAO|nr:unnamed protein product [Parnassius apollo]